LERLPIALFDVYWIKSNGPQVKIHSMGSYISKKKVSRMKKSFESFNFVWKINTNWILEGIEKFQKLNELSTKYPSDLFAFDEWRIDFINWATPSLWNGDSLETSYLDLVVLICLFLKIGPDDFYENFDLLANEVQGRSLVIASSLCFLGIVIGHCEREYLSDLYRTFLYIDYLHCEGGVGEGEYRFVEKGCLPGFQQLTENEQELSREDYLNSINRVQQMIIHKLKYRFVADYLKWGLEDFRGLGEVVKVKMNEMSDLELIMILLFRGVIYEKNMLAKPVGQTINKLVVGSMNLSNRIRKVILSSIQIAGERDINFLKISES